jgi:hypothetical protein
MTADLAEFTGNLSLSDSSLPYSKPATILERECRKCSSNPE